MSHINLDSSRTRRLRTHQERHSNVTVTLAGTYIIPDEGSEFHFVNPGGVARTVFLPAHTPDGGAEYSIANTGIGTLNVVDANGVAVASIGATSASRFIEGKNIWGVTAGASGSGLPALADGLIWIGDGTNSAIARALSGDITVSDVGVVAIGALKVTNAMLAGSIAISKLAITGTPTGSKFLRDDGSWQVPASNLTVGTSGVASGTSGRVLFDNASVLGEYAISGTGSVAMTTSPVFVTPTLGAASATTINNVTITQPASSATLTIANTKTLTASNTLTLAGVDGKTLTVNNSLTFAGTDATTMTFPGASDTVGGLGTSQTWTKDNVHLVARTIASAAGAVLDDLKVSAATTTVTGSTQITTSSGFNKVSIYRPTITDASAVTIDNAASFYVDNSPLAAGSVTLTNSWSIWVGAGATKLQATTLSGALTYGGVLLSNSVTGTGSMVLSAAPTFTGAALFGDGTVSLPGLAFSGDTDSGLYRIGPNNIALSVNGAKATDIGTTYVALPASYYLNFGATTGTTGYGIRDNAGTMEFKASGGAWVAIGGAAGGLTVGTSTIASGTSGRVLYDNGGVLGEMTTTGTGTVLVLATSPVLVTPTLGVAVATTINKVTITQPATSAVLTITDGKTLSVSNTLTFAGTDSTTMTFPAASTTVGGLGTSQTWTQDNIHNVARTIASATSAVLDDLKVSASTTTVTGTTSITTATGFNKVAIYRPTITDASAVTITAAASLYIENSPLAAGSVTLTNTLALWVGAGISKFGGAVQHADGTVALPGLSFASDTDTGMYRIGANNIGLATNGVLSFDLGTSYLALPASYYLNFGATSGTSGYGVRDNVGKLEAKDSGGVWARIAGGSGVLLATLTASSSTSLDDQASVTSAYNDYLVIFENLVPATNNTILQLLISSAATFQTTGYQSGGIQAGNANTSVFVGGSTTEIPITGPYVSNTTADGGCSGFFRIYSPSNTAGYKSITGLAGFAGGGTTWAVVYWGGAWKGGTGAVDGIRIKYNSGNIVSGTVKIYGFL